MVRVLIPLLFGALVGATAVVSLQRARNLEEPTGVFSEASEDRRWSSEVATYRIATATGSVDSDVEEQVQVSMTQDAEAALATLSAIVEPVTRREAALALLEKWGSDSLAVDRIAAALRPVEVLNFAVDAIVSRASHSPNDALAAAMALGELPQQRLALQRLAPVFASQDPIGVFSGSYNLNGSQLESEFKVNVLDAWAEIDYSAVLNYLGSANDSQIVGIANTTLQMLAESDPEGLWSVAADLRPRLRERARSAAVAALVREDPNGAFTLIDSLAPDQHDVFKQTAAEAFAIHDPESAWTWAQEQGQFSFELQSQVINGIQKVDPDLALEIVLTGLSSPIEAYSAEMRQHLSSYLFSVNQSGRSDETNRVLDQLIHVDGTAIEALVHRTLSVWASTDPEAALDWSLRNVDRIDPGRFKSVGYNLARESLTAAQQTVYRLPTNLRLPWVEGVADAITRSDPSSAESWVLSLPRGPLRDSGLNTFLSNQAVFRGSVDAQLFSQFSVDNDTRARVARSVSLRLACVGGDILLAQEIARTHINNPTVLQETLQQVVSLTDRSWSQNQSRGCSNY